MDRRWRPVLDISAFVAAALVCAWISNAFAGPTRRLSWLPERIVPLVPIVAPVSSPAPNALVKTTASPAPVHRKAPAPESTDWDPASLLARFPPLQGRPYADISGDEARWLQLHGALILDARRSDIYAAGHIPAARSLPVWEDGLQEKIARLGADHADPILPVVVYCAGGECEDSHLLAQKLWLAGYRNLRIYAGGFPEWEARGWPAHRGEHP